MKKLVEKISSYFFRKPIYLTFIELLKQFNAYDSKLQEHKIVTVEKYNYIIANIERFFVGKKLTNISCNEIKIAYFDIYTKIFNFFSKCGASKFFGCNINYFAKIFS